MLLRTLRWSCAYTTISRRAAQARFVHLQPLSASRPMEVLAAAEATSPELDGLRLSNALSLLFPGRWNSATALKRAVRRGEVRVNGAAVKIDSTLQLGDRVEVVTPMGCARIVTHVNRQQQQQQLPGLDVAFEDDHMAVIIKPQGLLSQGPRGPASVAGRIKYCLKPTPLPGALSSPVMVHRLDVGTGGLLMVAKTRPAATALTRDLAEHNMQKRYLALVLGHLTGCGVIDHPVSDRSAVTLFRVEGHRPSATFGALTLVSLWPKTGRTHQLRKHMAYIGHPILGDLQYKFHRKPDCRAVLTDINSWLPQPTSSTWSSSSQQHNQQRQLLPVEVQPGAGPLPGQQQEAPQHRAACVQKPLPLPPQQLRQDLPENVPAQMRTQEAPVGRGHSNSYQHGQQPCAEVSTVLVCGPDIDLDIYKGTSSYFDAASKSASSTQGSDSPDADGDASSGGSSSGDAVNSGSSGCRQRGDVLQDGTVVGTCLWAVQLQLVHPVTGQYLDISVGVSPSHLYDRICQLDAAVTP